MTLVPIGEMDFQENGSASLIHKCQLAISLIQVVNLDEADFPVVPQALAKHQNCRLYLFLLISLLVDLNVNLHVPGLSDVLKDKYANLDFGIPWRWLFAIRAGLLMR